MDALARAFLGAADDEAESAALVEQIRDLLVSGGLPFVQLVAALREPLTDADDDEGRGRAVLLVAQVSGLVDLKQGEVEHLADFFAGKLEDWASVKAALQGCLQLTQRCAPALAASPGRVDVMARALATGVQLPSLSVLGRQAGLQLWLELLKAHGPRLATAGGLRLASRTAALVEGETDPRCLLLAFACVRAAAAAYDVPPASARRADFQADADELFEAAIEPYFPVRFTPKKGDPGAITRRQLAGAVAGCMAAAPEFAPLAVPLLSGKLGSALREAKEDVLDALPLCCRGWGAGAVSDHLLPLWVMLKQELLAPAALEGSPQDDVDAARATAARAAAALRDCAAALGPGQLDRAVLDDVAVEDLQRYLAIGPEEAAVRPGGGGGTLAALRGRPAQRLACIAEALGAVAASGPLGCAGACSAVVDPLLDAVLGGDSSSNGETGGGGGGAAPPVDLGSATLGGGLAALTALVSAVAAAPSPEARRGEAGAPHPLAARAGRVAALLDLVQSAVEASSGGGGGGGGGAEAWQLAAQARVWCLRLSLQLLLASAAGAAPLPQARADAAVARLVSAALQPPPEQDALASADSAASAAAAELWLDWDRPADPWSEAMDALRALSKAAEPPAAADGNGGGGDGGGGPSAAASAAAADDPVLAAAVRASVERLLLPALKDGAAVGRALAALQLLAGRGPGGAWQLLCWLQPLVVAELAAGCAGSGALAGAYLSCLHRCSLPLLPLELPADQAAAAAAMVEQLLSALHLARSEGGAAAGGAEGGGAAAPGDQLQAALLLLSQLIARCGADAQAPLLLSACEWASEAAAAAESSGGGGGAAAGPLAPPAAARAAAAAAVLVGARPELLRGDSLRGVAEALALVALAPGPTRAPAAVALGAVVNKWAPAAAGGSAAAGAEGESPSAALVLGLADGLLLPAAAAAGGAGTAEALACVAWMARGLAMLRDGAWLALAERALDVPALETDDAAADAAARLFEVLLSDTPPSGGGGGGGCGPEGEGGGWQLDGRSSRARARPLWQQKAFVLALKLLGDRSAAAAAAAAAEAPASGDLLRLQRRQEVLALCTCALVSSAPRGVYASAADAVAAQLVPCMARAACAPCGPCGGGAAAAHAAAREARLHAALLVLGDFLTDAALLPLMERDADGLMRLLLALATRPGPRAAAARETAMQCLVAAMQLPYRLLHPHRRAALRAIAAALDDDRRAVRVAAVRARRVWSSA